MNSKQKTLFLIVTFLAISLFLIFGIILPWFKDIQLNSEKLFLVRKDLAILDQKATEIPELENKFQALGPELEDIEHLFVDSKTPIDFLRFLESMAKDSNLTIRVSLLPTKPKEVTAFPALNFELSLMGSFSNCFKFLEKLELAPYLIDIEDFTIVRLTEKQLESETYKALSLEGATFNLSLRAFAQPR